MESNQNLQLEKHGSMQNIYKLHFSMHVNLQVTNHILMGIMLFIVIISFLSEKKLSALLETIIFWGDL